MKLSLSTLFSFLAVGVSAAPYVVTSYVVLSLYTYPAETIGTQTYSESVYTYNQVVVSPTSVTPLSTFTTTAEYSEVTMVEIVVPSGQEVSYDYFASYTDTSYVVPVTYSPAPTCTSQNWTFTTNVPVYVPAIVSLAPVTTFESTSTISYAYYQPTTTTNLVAVMNPTDINTDDLASASSEYAPWGMTYCYTPTTYCPTASAAQCTTTFVYDSVNGNDSINYPYYGSDNGWNRVLILICVLVPVGWFLLWFLIGLCESWMSFKGLMLGQHRKRGLPYAWCCISILFLCWTGPTYKAKSVEEQAILLEKWKALKAGEKFKLWMKWGFRWKYPRDVIGEEPEVAKRAFRQGCL